MANELWKTWFRERVVEADGRCSQVPGLIVAAQGHLAEPVRAGGAIGMEGRVRIKLAEEVLGRATDDLAFAMSGLGGATELALRGGGVIPSVPLSSIHSLRSQDAAQRNAVGKVRDARLRGGEAYRTVELCCDHLLVVVLLLDRPGLPGVDVVIDSERLRCTDALERALEMAQDCAVLTAGARLDLGDGAN